LVGNPNGGKTTLFNALTGLTQHTGNYPGVTVEWHDGSWQLGGCEATLLDLPGAYSLNPHSADEAVVRDVLAGRVESCPRPVAVVALLDASNLERSLYLLSQVLELGLPVVVALNMVDVAASKGIRVDAAILARRLGVPVCPIRANRRQGLAGLARAAKAALDGPPAPRPDLEREQHTPQGDVVVATRYAWARRVLADVVERPVNAVVTASDRIDRVLARRWGLLIFLAVVALVFQGLFSWTQPLSNAIADGMSGLGSLLGSLLPAGALQSLLVDGALAGVGAVLTFTPQIALLFICLAVLEDCGYMARGAYLMDRFFSRLGLSGQSFIPLLSSFACAVPGIMATRTISSRRERLTVMLVAPLMSCSARLPVYTVMIGAFVPARKVAGLLNLQGLVLMAFYLLGILVAIPVSLLAQRFLLRKASPTLFVMELPSYKWPDPRTVFIRSWLKVKAFVVTAGTFIFCISLLVWALAYFPHAPAIHQRTLVLQAAAPAQAQALAAQESGEYLRQSFIGRAGKALEPAFKPLGWDWRITMAALASFPAREVVIATLGTIFNVDQEGEGERRRLKLSESLRQAAWPDGRPLFNLGVALSLMAFFALCAQCASTLVVLRQESGGWAWPALTFGYMTCLAYGFAWAAYQGSRALGWA
jgi:ferrous iron transport protein B